jgi:serine/threonine protein kinase/formylglycine-generating enzyme required for sulfatase activity
MQFRCPNCDHPIQIRDVPVQPHDRTEAVTCPSCQSKISLSSDSTNTHIPIDGLSIGHLDLQQIVGEGAFGTVYKAWDRNLQRAVAIKLPRQDRMRADSGKSFLREARASAKIHHPNVVQVYEVGQSESGFYIVSEFIEGITLSEWLKIRDLTPEAASRLMITICRAVQAAHDAEVIHRDLKPGNVLMDTSNTPHVADFGLARQSGTDITVTHDGRIVGTPSYMSPEQARGNRDEVTRLSDVWSLGVMLYEMVVQCRPFVATDSHSVLYRILTDEPQQPRKLRPSLPIDLQTIILKALEKKPSDRFQSASAMADDLQRFLDNKPIEAKPTARLRRIIKWSQRNPRLAAVSSFCAMLLVVVVALLLRSKPEATDIVRTFPIQIKCSLDGQPAPSDQSVRWAAVPIDPGMRSLRESDAVRNTGSVFQCELPPGEYLFVVEAEGYGFHEVYRVVPESPQTLTRLFNHQSTELLPGGVVGLPEVRIRPSTDVTSNMAFIAGGAFEMGDKDTSRLAHQRQVDSFWIDSREVTVSEYKQFSSTDESFLKAPGDHAVVDLTFFEALAYAEFAGKRLITEREFEYAATNRGRTVYPWGDDARPDGELWGYSNAGLPDWDKLPDTNVFGLHSNVAEWTDSWPETYPGMPPWPADLVKHRNLLGTRVARGGPVTLGPNDRSKNTWSETPKARAAWNAMTEDTEIGFRCGRSERPRFMPVRDVR